jgi:hypothetical protein
LVGVISYGSENWYRIDFDEPFIRDCWGVGPRHVLDYWTLSFQK